MQKKLSFGFCFFFLSLCYCMHNMCGSDSQYMLLNTYIHCALARCAYAYSNIWCYRLKSFMIVIISWLSSTLVNDGFSGFGIYFSSSSFSSFLLAAANHRRVRLRETLCDPLLSDIFEIVSDFSNVEINM